MHGLHGVLWALDALLAQVGPGRGPASLDARFRRPIGLGASLAVVCTSLSEASAALSVIADGDRATTIRLGLGSLVEAAAPGAPDWGDDPPRERALADLVGASGILPVGVDPDGARGRWPALLAAVGAAGIADLLALTRLVGMECPGRWSIFSGLQLTFRSSPGDGLRWSVTEVDDRFSRVRIAVSSRTFAGEVEAFVRPRPVEQATFEAIRSAVDPGRFEGWRALIVGGSRGLGEVAAKLIAAGGGRVTLTWHLGERDALRVVDQIRAGGGRARGIQLDVAAVGRPLPEATHLAYFASPKITPVRGPFRSEVYRRYLEAYVHGFGAVVEAATGEGPLRVLYPSTVLIDDADRGFAEYAAAKAAGEALCRALDRCDRRLSIRVERFARLATDQTRALGATGAADPVPAVLQALVRPRSVRDQKPWYTK